jgi:hypothetical protein
MATPDEIVREAQEQQDAAKVLEQMIGVCDRTGDGGHIWRKCKRCLTFSILQDRDPRAERLIRRAIEGLALLASERQRAEQETAIIRNIQELLETLKSDAPTRIGAIHERIYVLQEAARRLDAAEQRAAQAEQERHDARHDQEVNRQMALMFKARAEAAEAALVKVREYAQCKPTCASVRHEISGQPVGTRCESTSTTTHVGPPCDCGRDALLPLQGRIRSEQERKEPDDTRVDSLG